MAHRISETSGIIFPLPGPPPPPQPASPTELMEAGKWLRTTVPRLAHGVWKQPASRGDPIALQSRPDAERLPEQVPVRYGRVLVLRFTFSRGASTVMAIDLAAQAGARRR
jgi:hypothetical protein